MGLENWDVDAGKELSRLLVAEWEILSQKAKRNVTHIKKQTSIKKVLFRYSSTVTEVTEASDLEINRSDEKG